MERLTNLINKLKLIESTIFEAIEKAIRDNEDIITEMNSEDQLFDRGVDRFGTKIADYAPYSPITIELKKIKGQPTSRVTLRDTGDFHLSFYIDFQSDGFELKASDWKTETLIKGYGEGILGLTDDNFKDLADNYVAPAIIEILKTL